MKNLKVNFFSEDVSFHLKNKRAVKALVIMINDRHKKLCGSINYIFCSDEYLLNINKQYLNHHDYTDIITFEDYDPLNNLSSDIYISIDRVKENANKFEVSFEQELIRVISHGILHISGFKDKTKEERTLMQSMENECITCYFSTLE